MIRRRSVVSRRRRGKGEYNGARNRGKGGNEQEAVKRASCHNFNGGDLLIDTSFGKDLAGGALNDPAWSQRLSQGLQYGGVACTVDFNR